MLKHLNIFKWLGWLFAPIQKNGAFFVFAILSEESWGSAL